MRPGKRETKRERESEREAEALHLQFFNIIERANVVFLIKSVHKI